MSEEMNRRRLLERIWGKKECGRLSVSGKHGRLQPLAPVASAAAAAAAANSLQKLRLMQSHQRVLAEHSGAGRLEKAKRM